MRLFVQHFSPTSLYNTLQYFPSRTSTQIKSHKLFDDDKMMIRNEVNRRFNSIFGSFNAIFGTAFDFFIAQIMIG